MWYVFVEIAVLLAIALILGALAGWALWRWRRVNLSREEYNALRVERAEMQQAEGRAIRERDEMERHLNAVRGDYDELRLTMADREAELAELRSRERTLLIEREEFRAERSDLRGGGATGLFSGASAVAPISTPPNSPREADDLTSIRGIGLDIQSFLRRQGIWTFRDLANLSEVDLDAIQEQLPDYPNRVRNDDWVGQARRLYDEKYGSLEE